jgi:hypothetical protein
MFSWAPYLLNQFLIDCRDAQDNGTEFHYSWLLILIALVGWKEPKFSTFVDRKGKCYAVRYKTLWQAKDNKNQQENNTVFSMFLEDMQQKTTNVWRIPIEVVQENEGISRFKASKHHMWIQATRDPKKKWLEMQYCISREEVDWIVKDWPAQWKVPTTKKEAKPKEKEEAGTSKKTSSPAENTRKVAEHAQASGSSATTKNPRKKETMSREEVKGDDKNGETSRPEEEDA